MFIRDREGEREMTGVVMITKGCGRKRRKRNEDQSQVSSVALLLAAIRRSMVSCRIVDRHDDVTSAVAQMEIGWPTNVCHVTHVTFDRFNGFLGLPEELKLEIPRRVPSASASVFGVSAESMQCSYDSRGNSVPTILLLMQQRLYSQGGLKAEGIFRINPENSQEEHVRYQLNKGIVPEDIDVHCLAALIKAWFRELPEGVLDGLSPEQVLQCNTEEDGVELVKQLLPTQAALLNWAVDLMADVVDEEEINKMNARNIAMVFAPNMTQMADPLTALMHAVQVMNFLKTLILKTLREREENADGSSSRLSSTSSEQQADEDDCNSEHDGEMGCDVKEHLSDENDAEYSQNSEDEFESLNEVEECFLWQLEKKEGDSSTHYKMPDEPTLHSVRTRCSVHVEERQVISSDLNTESSFSTSISRNTGTSLSTSLSRGDNSSDIEDSGDCATTMGEKNRKESSEGCQNGAVESSHGLLSCLHARLVN